MVRLWGLFIYLFMPLQTDAMVGKDTDLLDKVFGYAAHIDTTSHDSIVKYSYQKFFISTDRRNFTLLAVPSLYAIAHGDTRQFVGERYDRIVFDNTIQSEAGQILEINSIPHHRRTLTTLLKYLMPRIYHVTLIKDHILSPFHRENKKLYKYNVYHLDNGNAKITFKPRIDNTQLVRGAAIIDPGTGRVIETEISGEHDMIRFRLTLNMGKEGLMSLVPSFCRLESKFAFMGNKLHANYSVFLQDSILSQDSIKTMPQDVAMELVRAEPLAPAEQAVMDEYQERQTPQDTIPRAERKKNIAKTILWDYVGDKLINRIRSDFGNNKQGYIRIDPLLNPLYLGYSSRRGVVYKQKIRFSYVFSPNSDLFLELRAGYSFKQHLFYYNIPLEFYYNRKHNGAIIMELGNGNRISTYEIINAMKMEYGDSLKWDNLKLDLFKDTYLKLLNTYDVNDQFSFEVGMLYHKRESVDKEAFRMANRKSTYNTFSPYLSLQYRPTGWRGPILTLDYERGYENFLKSTVYERWEFDGSYIHPLSRIRSISMRIGMGLYTNRDSKQYFLDFTHFRENNIPGGWRDDWSGEFELLSSEWYNASRYYLRANMTYESPLLLLTHTPWIGHFIELERIYASGLSVKDLSNYFEFGYGFTTRWLSIATFVAMREGKYDGFGCKFGVELFRKW